MAAGANRPAVVPLDRAELLRLRSADIDRYLSLLLMPRADQPDLLTLMLFNAEIAQIRDKVREPLPGEIRLQWWRDVLGGERAGEAQAHPLAARLIEMVTRRSLPVAALQAMCDARIFDLYDDPMPDRASYEGYAGETAAAMLQMSAMIMDPDVSNVTATLSGHAGVAQAVAGHLMMLPLAQARGQVFLPGDMLAATGLDRDSLLAGDNRSGIAAAIRAFSGYGRDHLSEARTTLKSVPASVGAAYLPVALVEPVLSRAEKLGADCLQTVPRAPQWLRQWRLWRAARSGQF